MTTFLKIYFWQVLSLITGFATLFIVTPFLSSNPTLFGVYSIVTSLSIFLSYADLGFLSAGVKYASECVSRNERKEEIKITGFVTFILLLFVGQIGLVAAFLSLNPSLLIKNLTDTHSANVAKNLLIIFACFTPILVLQRSAQIIFNIRLKDYIYQRIFTAANFAKIVAAYFFFRNGKYLLIEYFLFSQVIGLVAVCIVFVLAKRSFDYNLKVYFGSIKFNRAIFDKTKKLAYSSLFITISWVVFYEIDLFVIGRFIGAKEVAILSLCIAVMTLFRSLHAILYNPFVAKFNHYVGTGDHTGFRSTFIKVLVTGLPISIFPTLIVALTVESFIYSWVGQAYASVIPVAGTMVLIYLWTFVSNPASIAIVAYEKIRSIYFINALMPLIYWIGVALTYSFWGLYSFGIFKLVAYSVSAIVYSRVSVKLFSLNLRQFFRDNIFPAMAVAFTLYILIFLTKQYLPDEKGAAQLSIYALICVMYLSFCLVSYYILSQSFRTVVKEVSVPVLKRLTAVKG